MVLYVIFRTEDMVIPWISDFPLTYSEYYASDGLITQMSMNDIYIHAYWKCFISVRQITSFSIAVKFLITLLMQAVDMLSTTSSNASLRPSMLCEHSIYLTLRTT